MEKQKIENLLKDYSFSSGFTEEHLEEVKKILKKESKNLSGKFFSTSSGGGFCHLFFQLKDFRWLSFHNSVPIDSQPIVTVKSYKTSKSLETAFFNDKMETTFYYQKKITKAEYLAATKTLIQWCKENKRDVTILYPRGKH